MSNSISPGASDFIGAVYRREVGRCTATLIRILGDVDLAEDAVAEAFAIAAARWPVDGMPPNPGGWITTTARNRAINHLRRESSRDGRHRAAHRLHSPDMASDPGPDHDTLDALVDMVADDQLRMIFLCCHPALSTDAQVALTLRLLGGLDTPEIARAFVVPEATMAQRIVRGKRKLRDNNASYRIPTAAELPDRLTAVLATTYLIFTEGHTATSGDTLVRTHLSGEAIRLGRVLVELMPDEPEALGLLALMLLTDARRHARTAPDGSMVRLADQDRIRWDQTLIGEGHDLVRACLRRDHPGPYQIQAAIAAVHADAPTYEATDWTQIVALYDQLCRFRPNPVVALNRAIAITELDGPAAGLTALDTIDSDQLVDFQPYHATRADLLARAGRPNEAADAYRRAIQLTTSQAERAFLTHQLQALNVSSLATMTSTPKIGYLELPATDLTATKSFYSDAFGWSWVEYGPSYAAFEGAGIEGGLNGDATVAPPPAQGSETGIGPLVLLACDDLASAEEAVTGAGGVITSSPYDYPGGRRFHFSDPSGNVLGVFQTWT